MPSPVVAKGAPMAAGGADARGGWSLASWERRADDPWWLVRVWRTRSSSWEGRADVAGWLARVWLARSLSWEGRADVAGWLARVWPTRSLSWEGRADVAWGLAFGVMQAPARWSLVAGRWSLVGVAEVHVDREKPCCASDYIDQGS